MIGSYRQPGATTQLGGGPGITSAMPPLSLLTRQLYCYGFDSRIKRDLQKIAGTTGTSTGIRTQSSPATCRPPFPSRSPTPPTESKPSPTPSRTAQIAGAPYLDEMRGTVQLTLQCVSDSALMRSAFATSPPGWQRPCPTAPGCSVPVSARSSASSPRTPSPAPRSTRRIRNHRQSTLTCR